MQHAHPALSVRPFLTGIDSSITDAQLEMVYSGESALSRLLSLY